MPEELLINVTPLETRVGIVENGVLQEIIIERTRKRGLVGNIFLGRVSRVLPGMGAAFIDIGLERTAFLHASDIVDGRGPGEPTIESLVHEGQAILVQVTKDPLGSKGARLTTQISIPSCHLVLLPNASTVGISQKIADELERARLRAAMLELDPGLDDGSAGDTGDAVRTTGNHGYIVRTAAEAATAEELAADMQFLGRLWTALERQVQNAKPPQVIYEDLPLALRMVRDRTATSTEKIRVDSRETLQKMVDFSREFTPAMLPVIEHYSGERPIMDLYGIEDEIQRALQRKVDLKSGGHLVIDQTEAMTTIDVNTGGFVGHRNLEETIFKTNLEAAQAIARQLRLRNLGGIIIIDFIDMADADHRRQVLRTLERSVEHDRTKISLSEVTSLGLVQLTRKRTRESLERVLCETCPTCSGRGAIKTAETVVFELFREILRTARQFDAQKLLVVASSPIVQRLSEEDAASLAELEAFIGIPVRLQVENTYGQEQYDVVFI
ncbi:MAG: ribonuclease G [Gammaproteobacteria bacterium]|nr:ribonuclease G [Gammaproteobacteria bacterium]